MCLTNIYIYIHINTLCITKLAVIIFYPKWRRTAEGKLENWISVIIVSGSGVIHGFRRIEVEENSFFFPRRDCVERASCYIERPRFLNSNRDTFGLEKNNETWFVKILTLRIFEGRTVFLFFSRLITLFALQFHEGKEIFIQRYGENWKSSFFFLILKPVIPSNNFNKFRYRVISNVTPLLFGNLYYKDWSFLFFFSSLNSKTPLFLGNLYYKDSESIFSFLLLNSETSFRAKKW